MPGARDPAEAAPLLCAGITSFNSLRHSGAQPGDLVAVQGIAGLGHLGVQFANKFGYKVAAISRGKQLQKLGGAQVILATAPNSKAMTSLHGWPR